MIGAMVGSWRTRERSVSWWSARPRSARGPVRGWLPTAGAAAFLAVSLTACGGGGSSGGSSGPDVCGSVPSADVAKAIGTTVTGTPKTITGGHACVWDGTSGGNGVLAVVLYDDASALPKGNNATDDLASQLSLSTDGFSNTNSSTTTGSKPVALLLLTNGSMPDQSVLTTISGDAMSAT